MRRLFRVVDPALIVLGALVVLVLAAYGGRRAHQRWIEPYTIVVATGGHAGESHLLGEALKTVIEDRFANVHVVVRETRGTDENLGLLAAGEAQLAFAQADVVLDYADTIDTREAALVAVLFPDLFQVLTCREGDATFDAVLHDLRDPSRQETVYLTVPGAREPSGGQLASFLRLAHHFRLDGVVRFADASPPPAPAPFVVRDDHDPRDDDGDGAPDGLVDRSGTVAACDADHAGDLVFRVRVPGNDEVQAALDRGWRLVGLEEIGAMQLENGALEAAVLPAGAYRVNGHPAPPHDLATLSTQRVLLSRRGAVPTWLSHEVARALNEDGQTLAEAILARAPGRDTYARERVVPLLARIRGHNDPAAHARVGVPLDRGAYGYYAPNESWFSTLNAYADGLAFAVTVGGVVVTGVFGLNRLLGQVRKDTADRYLALAGFLERHGVRSPRTPRSSTEQDFAASLRDAVTHAQPPVPGLQTVWPSLVEGRRKLELLSDVFADAGESLAAEAISEESYRTFTEAHAAAREAIGAQMEEDRRKIVLIYVNRLMALLEATEPDLDGLLVEASAVLRDDLVFSRESFRTFTDAYTVVAGQLRRRAGMPDES